MKKKFNYILVFMVVTFLLVVIFLLFACKPTSEIPPLYELDGKGTADNPYKITTAEDILWLSEWINDGNVEYNNKFYKLTNNIDLSNLYLTPIGKKINPFKGSFNGNGYEIINLHINKSIEGAGLFGYIAGGSVENLGVTKSNIKGDFFVGGIVGCISGNIENCYFTGNIYGIAYAGGIAGLVDSNSKIINCYSTATINGQSELGGIAGYINSSRYYFYLSDSKSSITNCYSTGTVTGHSQLGGIVDYMDDNCHVINCYSAGTIEIVSGTNYVGAVGGIAGWIDGDNCYITNCYSTGIINGCSWVGGIAGLINNSNSYISSSYSASKVSGQDSIGGIVGETNGHISNCYSTGTVSGISLIGGVAGRVCRSRGDLINCYSTAAVSGSSYIGGLAGFVEDSYSVINCIALNPSVNGDTNVGRIAGGSSTNMLLHNYAYSLIEDKDNQTSTWTNKTLKSINGADINAEDALLYNFWITTSNWYTLYGADKWNENFWIIENGKLPVIKNVGVLQNGNPPAYLR